jgi:hypothetical protein
VLPGKPLILLRIDQLSIIVECAPTYKRTFNQLYKISNKFRVSANVRNEEIKIAATKKLLILRNRGGRNLRTPHYIVLHLAIYRILKDKDRLLRPQTMTAISREVLTSQATSQLKNS